MTDPTSTSTETTATTETTVCYVPTQFSRVVDDHWARNGYGEHPLPPLWLVAAPSGPGFHQQPARVLADVSGWWREDQTMLALLAPHAEELGRRPVDEDAPRAVLAVGDEADPEALLADPRAVLSAEFIALIAATADAGAGTRTRVTTLDDLFWMFEEEDGYATEPEDMPEGPWSGYMMTYISIGAGPHADGVLAPARTEDGPPLWLIPCDLDPREVMYARDEYGEGPSVRLSRYERFARALIAVAPSYDFPTQRVVSVVEASEEIIGFDVRGRALRGCVRPRAWVHPDVLAQAEAYLAAVEAFRAAGGDYTDFDPMSDTYEDEDD